MSYTIDTETTATTRALRKASEKELAQLQQDVARAMAERRMQMLGNWSGMPSPFDPYYSPEPKQTNTTNKLLLLV